MALQKFAERKSEIRQSKEYLAYRGAANYLASRGGEIFCG